MILTLQTITGSHKALCCKYRMFFNRVLFYTKAEVRQGSFSSLAPYCDVILLMVLAIDAGRDRP